MSTDQPDPTAGPSTPGHSVPPPTSPVPDDRVYGDDRVDAQPYGASWLQPSLSDPAASPAPAPTGPPPAPPPPPWQPRRRSSGRPWLFIGLGAALLLAAGAGVGSWGFMTGGFRQTVEQNQVYPGVRAIEFNGSSGDVEVRADSASGTVALTRRLSWGPGSSQPTPDESVQDGTLHVTTDCSGFMSWCSVDYVMHVPTGTVVTLRNGSGDIELSGDLGATEASTGSGDVTVTGGGDTLKLSAGSGDIEASGLEATQVIGNTGSGSLDLDFARAPDDVSLEAGSGDVTVSLPRGSYAVDVTTGSGDESVTVTDDPTASDHVRVKTGSGNVEVAYR